MVLFSHCILIEGDVCLLSEVVDTSWGQKIVSSANIVYAGYKVMPTYFNRAEIQKYMGYAFQGRRLWYFL